MSEESKELIVIEKEGVEQIFKEGGSKTILSQLKKRLDEFVVPDVTTKKGRDEIASFSYAFSKSKTYIDKFRIALVEKEKARLKIIDNEGKIIKDTCDLYRDLARKPLTDWENAEKERVAKHEQNIQTINDYINVEVESSTQAKDLLEALKLVDTGEVFEEFELAATKAKAAALTQLEAKFIVLQNAEKEKAEAERLEKERLEKEREEREKRIAEEAVEAEKRRQEEETKREAEESKKREENKRHRNKIVNEILDDLTNNGFPKTEMRCLIDCILDSKIRHLKIEF